MKNQSIVNLVVIIFLGIIIILLLKNNANNKATNQFKQNQSNHFTNNDNTFPSKESNNNQGDPKEINRHPSHLIYTKHAKCRMQCRNLDESEVLEILDHGQINYRKSNDRQEQCPTYALEGKTHDGQDARMVFAFCGEDEVKVITVIDLDTDWTCNCY